MTERHPNRQTAWASLERYCSCGNPIRRGLLCDTCRDGVASPRMVPVVREVVTLRRPVLSGWRVG